MNINYNPRVEYGQFSGQYDSRAVNYDRKVLYKIDHSLFNWHKKLILPGESFQSFFITRESSGTEKQTNAQNIDVCAREKP